MSVQTPTVVRIGAQTWRIKRRKQITHRKRRMYGVTYAESATIELACDVAPCQARDTMLHELLHACASNTPHGLTYEQEEAFIAGVTPFLLTALRDNADLMLFLLSAG